MDGGAPWVCSLRRTGGPVKNFPPRPLWQSKRYPEEDAPNPFQKDKRKNKLIFFMKNLNQMNFMNLTMSL